MKRRVFEGFGCEILRDGTRWFIRADSGGAASWMTEGEITEEEAIKAQRSEHDGYLVLLALDKRGGSRRIDPDDPNESIALPST